MNSNTTPFFTEEYYYSLKNLANTFTEVVNKLQSDESLLESVKDCYIPDNKSDFIPDCILFDLIKIYQFLNTAANGELKLGMTGMVILSSRVKSRIYFIKDFFDYDYQKLVQANLLLLGESLLKGANNDTDSLRTAFNSQLGELNDIAKIEKSPLRFKVIKVDDDVEGAEQKVENILALLPALKILEDDLFVEYSNALFAFATVITQTDKNLLNVTEPALKQLKQFIYNPIPQEILTMPTLDKKKLKSTVSHNSSETTTDSTVSKNSKPNNSSTLFSKVALKNPNLLQKLFKSEPKKNAIIELNNLLATKPIGEISIEEIENISSKYKIDFYKKYSENLKELYLTLLKNCLVDKLLTDEEIDELRSLKHLLGLRDSGVEILHNKVATDIYQKSFDEAIKDGRLDKVEEEFLIKLLNNLMLPKEIADKISTASKTLFINNYINQISSDERLTDDELKELDSIANNFNIKLELDDATKERLRKYRQYWNIENGTLPTVEVDINLPKGENCYLTSSVDWFENRTVTERINYAGPSVRIKIFKGFSYRAGSVKLQRITSEQLLHIDTGTIYLTNKRLIFVGRKKNTNIKLVKILSIAPYSDGIEIEKDSGKSPILRVSNSEMFLMILSRLINDATS